MNKKILKLAGIIGVGFLLIISIYLLDLIPSLYFPNNVEESVERARETIREIKPKSFKTPKAEISTPVPLTSPSPKETETPLSNDEIIKFTNSHRKKNGIKTLKKNNLLMKAATKKLDDMFKKQYFAHTSPTGKDAGNLLEETGYNYIIVGENLALGYFKSSSDLVNGWMKSPGHRENILNPKFKEIGVAQRKDNFQGKNQYLAVQVFATPTSFCILPDDLLLSQIQSERQELEELITEAEYLEQEIEEEMKRDSKTQEDIAELQIKIKTYNNLVIRINGLSGELEIIVSEYNLQVQSFNNCIDTF